MNYVATFYTHAAALMTHRKLKIRGCEAAMMPVPRALSSSCGTCVKYESDGPMEDCMDPDLEAIYAVEQSGYQKLLYND